MHGGIVKFNALTDTDRAGTKNDDSFFFPALQFTAFAVLVIRGIKIRRFRGKFSTAGVYHLINSVLMVGKGRAADPFQRSVGIAVFLALHILL